MSFFGNIINKISQAGEELTDLKFKYDEYSIDELIRESNKKSLTLSEKTALRASLTVKSRELYDDRLKSYYRSVKGPLAKRVFALQLVDRGYLKKQDDGTFKKTYNW